MTTTGDGYAEDDTDLRAATAEATEWHIVIASGEARISDIKQFETWLRRSPLNIEAYKRLVGVWDAMSSLATADIVAKVLENARNSNNLGIVADLKSHLDALSRTPSTYWRPMTTVIAISIVVLFVVNIFAPVGDVYRTDIGEQRTIQLADNSTIMLNTATTIAVDLSKNERRITLHTGQASFDVGHDAQRPFVVHAGDGVVRALGTQFDVYKSTDGITVTLIKGKVEVSARPANPAVDRYSTNSALVNNLATKVLAPGEQVAINSDGELSLIADVDVEQVVNWRRGNLYFRATPLIDAVAEVNRYSSDKIVIADSELNSLEVSGAFRIGGSFRFANALPMVIDVQVEQRPNGEIILSSKSTDR